MRVGECDKVRVGGRGGERRIGSGLRGCRNREGTEYSAPLAPLPLILILASPPLMPLVCSALHGQLAE